MRTKQQGGNLNTPDTSPKEVRAETTDDHHMDITAMLSPCPSAWPHSPVLQSREEVSGQRRNDAQDTHAQRSSENNDAATGCTNNVENAHGPSQGQSEIETASAVTRIMAVADGNGEVIQKPAASEGTHIPPIPENPPVMAAEAVPAVPKAPIVEDAAGMVAQVAKDAPTVEDAAGMAAQVAKDAPTPKNAAITAAEVQNVTIADT
jgi:hypothetical protein